MHGRRLAVSLTSPLGAVILVRVHEFFCLKHERIPGHHRGVFILLVWIWWLLDKYATFPQLQTPGEEIRFRAEDSVDMRGNNRVQGR